MPDLTGLDLLRTLSHRPLTVLTTAYDKHAIEGYELEVMDYLLKPISFERFVQAITKCGHQLQLQQQATSHLQAPSALSSHDQEGNHPTHSRQDVAVKGELDHMYIKVDYKWTKISYHEILYIEGLREYVKVHMLQKKYVVYQALKRLAEWLPSKQFVRVHKFYIVSLDHITAIYGNTIEIQETEIPIGKSYKEDFFQRIQRS